MSDDLPTDASIDRGWPMQNRERTDAEHVGVVNANHSMFYFPASSEMARYEHDEESEELVEVSSHVVEAEEGIADAIERIGEETGWHSLSEWAERHVEPDEHVE